MSDSKIELERMYTVPLSRAWIAPRYRRTSRAVNVLKEFAERHMKSSEIKIDSELNERLWSRGITKPPRRITVKMTKDEDGLVTISLPKLEEQRPLAEPEESAIEDEITSLGPETSKQDTMKSSSETQQPGIEEEPERKSKGSSSKASKRSKRQKKEA
jgi:large subunit ribosomal protein L31e